MELLLKGLAAKYPDNESIVYLNHHQVQLNFVVVGYITDAFEVLTEEEFHPHLLSLLETVTFFHQKYHAIKDSRERVLTFHRDINEIISRDLFGKDGLGEEIVCSKGCYGCCSQLVSITKSEGELLLSAHKELDKGRLQKQAHLSTDTWTDKLTEEEALCVFLDKSDGSCSVWSHRPANCRNYFVSGSNEYCSVFKRNPEISVSHKSIYADLCVSAFYSLDGGEISLSTFLLKNTP